MEGTRQLNIKVFVFNYLQENCYLLWNEAGDCVIVDPGCQDDGEVRELEGYVASNGLHPKEIWLTHAHFDHIGGVKALVKDYAVPVMMNASEKSTLALNRSLAAAFGLPSPDMDGVGTLAIADGDSLDALGDPFFVIATPGHTEGGVCYYDPAHKVLLSGDTLFAGSIGRTDSPVGDYDKLITGIMESLMGLPSDVDVLPGHGRRSSIAEERSCNPFLQPFNEPEDPSADVEGIEFHL
jgi:glyoxylase-like metal-dependent hydrolase (beta-lactamase superfamily II)